MKILCTSVDVLQELLSVSLVFNNAAVEQLHKTVKLECFIFHSWLSDHKLIFLRVEKKTFTVISAF